METCIICKKEFLDSELIPCIDLEGGYAPMCLECHEKCFSEEEA